MLQVVVPQHFSDIRHPHGRTGMTGLGFLNGVHAERPDRIRKFSTRGHCCLLSVFKTDCLPR
jgi:hypothetical protein